MSAARLLVVAAVAAERDAISAMLGGDDRGVRVVAGGVGPAAAAATTAAELTRAPADLVLCAGIGGGFVPLAPGDIAVAAAVEFADLGADSPDGFLPAADLGFGDGHYDVEAKLAVELADRTGGHLGTVLTVATVTGTQARAQDLAGRFPQAIAEGMEGAGVAAGAQVCGVPFAELRAVSNAVGPRDRGSWQIPLALEALGAAVAAVVKVG